MKIIYCKNIDYSIKYLFSLFWKN